jgi:hypothetical protein
MAPKNSKKKTMSERREEALCRGPENKMAAPGVVASAVTVEKQRAPSIGVQPQAQAAADVNRSSGMAAGSWQASGNPNWVPTGPPLEFFPATSAHYKDWGNGGARMKGKGVKRLDPNQAPRMLYNAPLHQTMGQCCFCCTNKSVAGRSYIWVMENQLQTNLAVSLGACGRGKAGDNVHVQYYDDIDALMPLTSCQKMCQCRSDDVEPTAEWFDESSLICCCSCPSCSSCWFGICCPCWCASGEAIFIVPYESMPCPCCCCSNRTSSCGCPFCSEIALAVYALLLQGQSPWMEYDMFDMWSMAWLHHMLRRNVCSLGGELLRLLWGDDRCSKDEDPVADRWPKRPADCQGGGL